MNVGIAMLRIFRLTSLLFFPPLVAFAATWSGALVDSKCYESILSNRNPWETSPGAYDTAGDIRYCSPRAKTRSFALIQDDGSKLALDPAGNQKAIDLLRKAPARHLYVVNVTGEKIRKMLKVQVISLVPNPTPPSP
jgi:hypothetical protein